MSGTRILFVDDDDTFRSVLSAELRSRGFEVEVAVSVQTGMAAIQADEIAVALVDLRLPDGTGLEILHAARQRKPQPEVVVLTGHGNIDSAIEAMRAGAFDYLRKPCPMDELEVTIHKALERRELLQRNRILSDGLAPLDMGSEFIGDSDAFWELCELIDRVASSDSSVLILGETGAGKEVVAKLIHARSNRHRKPLVVVDCATLHEQLLDSELFGHERGAYTGALKDRHGLFEVADGGTVFLDEIGDVSLTSQVKLLRVLETGQFRRVGGTRELSTDVRVLAATNRDLNDMMERGYFRQDLFFRLNTIKIQIPPLRKRPDDIPVLIAHFLGRMGARFERAKRFDDEAMARLLAYGWPGNVREVRSVVERATLLSDSDVIGVENLPPELVGAACEPEPRASGLVSLQELERGHIARVLEASGGNREQAARILGISERTLYRKIKQYGL